MATFSRIEVDAGVMLGQPVIKGTRLPVYVIVQALAEGDSVEDVLDAYPFLSVEDVREALRFAAKMSQIGFEAA
jgi:uncharacterized protein (DUF433 family)